MATNQLVQARIDPWIPNETTIAAMKAAKEDKLPKASSIEELIKALRADD